MFSREIWALLILVCWGTLSGAAWADGLENVPQANTHYDMLLSPQDVERVCAAGGIRLVPKDPESGATGILNFAFYRGPVMLLLNGEDIVPGDFAKQKQTVSFKAMYAFRFQRLGEDAYEGPAHAGRPYILSFQKGHHWITLTSGLSRRGGKPFLSMEQLRELAQLVLERL
jgi:hypothetical protein